MNCFRRRKTRIEWEKATVELMIRLYCRKKEGNKVLCPACDSLLKYAHSRLERCPFGNGKTSCKHCRIHCYQPEMREKMRRVMQYAGPRMILYYPLAALLHLFNK